MKEVFLYTRRGLAWMASETSPIAVLRALKLTTKNGYGWSVSEVDPGENPAPTLSDLSIDPDSAMVGVPYSGIISGKTAGSILTLSGAGSAGLSVSGSIISGTPTSSGSVLVTETLSGASNSPKSSELITVEEVVIPEIPRYVVVATRGETSSNTIGAARSASNQKQRFRKQFFAGQGGYKANSLKLVLSAFGVPDSGSDTPTEGYAVEGHFEVGGVAYPFTWGGSSVGQIPFGAARVESDVAQGHPDVQPGTICYVVITREYAVGGRPVFDSAPGTNTVGDSAHFAVAGTDAGIGIPGAKTTGAGWSAQQNVYDLPFALIGIQISKAPAIFCFGASNERNQQDSSGDGTAGGGYVRRAFNPPGGTKQAFIMAAKRGETIATLLASGFRRIENATYANTVLLGFGGNEFTSGTPIATALANLKTLYDMIVAVGVERVCLLGMIIKTNSEDSYATVPGQNVRPGFIEYREAFHAGAEAMGITVIDTHDSWEDDAVPAWKANGTPNWSTGDGTHALVPRHQEAGQKLPIQMGPILIWN